MDITVSSTTKLVTFNGAPARVWEGVSEKGVPVYAFITRIMVPLEAGPDAVKQFEAELESHCAPSVEVGLFPSYMRIPKGNAPTVDADDGHVAGAV